MKTLSILVLEDHPFQSQVVVQQLRALGYRNLICASDGESALDILSNHGPVDIALCDISMPGMDGLTFLRKASERNVIRSMALFSAMAPDLRMAVLQLAELYGLQVLGELDKALPLDALHTVIKRYQHDKPSIEPFEDGQPTADEARLAMPQRQLLPYYQPKVGLHDLQPAGAEVLVRWQHPRLGLLGPDRFLPLLEELGLLRDLTQYMLESALGFLHWLPKEARLPLAINCPPCLLDDPELVANLRALLDYYRLPAKLLSFEITENGLLGRPADCLENLLRLRMMGCGVAIDDFGTGTSSLQRLCHLPSDELKLDGSFIRDMEHNPRAMAVVTSSLVLASSVGMKVVAEGIETTGQLEQLRELGCNQGQGYLFSRPMSGREFANWLPMNTARRPLRILVIEDHPMQLLALEKLLGQPGSIQITRAMSAEEAMHAYQQDAPPFDLAVCDQHLPDLPGLELLENLQRAGHIRHGIILSSAGECELANLRDRAHERDLPLLACLTKPLDLQHFKANIAPLLN